MLTSASPPGHSRVAIRIPRQSLYCQNLLRGVAAYASTRAAWRFVDDPVRTDASPVGLSNAGCDGVIAYVTRWNDLDQYMSLGIPVVNTTTRSLGQECIRVCADNDAIGVLAVDHLMGRGLRRLFILHSDIEFHLERVDAFMRRATALGLKAEAMLAPDETWQWRELVAEVLRDPMPVGMFCVNDVIARDCCRQFQQAGADVPQRISVLGCGNDELVCTFNDPGISSIDPDVFTAGYRAGELLDQLMSGQRDGLPAIRVPPAGVIERDSTEVLAVDDPVIAEAIRFVRSHACKGIRVSDVAQSVSVNRKTLGRGFRRAIGRTPLEEIRRVQLESIKQMLIETDFAIEKIAQRTGLRDGRYLSQVFRKAEHTTPTEYRAEHRRDHTRD